MTVSFNYLGQYGRLGNQMFQYAFLLGLHSKYGYEISIPPSDFKNAWINHQLFQAFKLKSLKKENPILKHTLLKKTKCSQFDPKRQNL